MGRNKKLAKNIGFVFVGNIGSKLVGFFMLPLYTYWLSPADFGLSDILGVYSNLLLNLVAFDMADAIFVFPSGEDNENIKKYYSTGFFFQIMCSVVLAVLFYGLSFVNSNNSFFSNIWFIYFMLISCLFQVYVQNFCRGINKMSVFSFTGIVNSLAIAISSILLIPKYGVLGFVVATILANVITGLFTFIYSKSYEYLTIHSFSKKHLLEMLKYSIPLMPTAVMWWLISSLNRPLVEQYCGLFALGLLAVGNKLPNIMNVVFSMFQQAWTVTVLEEYGKDGFDKYFNKMFKMIFLLQILICMMITVCAKPFINLMTTIQYQEAWKFIPLITFGTLFSNISAFIGAIFTATRKSNFTFISAISGGMGSIVLNILLIPKFGLWGACIAIILAHFLSAITRVYFSTRFVRLNASTFIVLTSMIAIACYLCCFIHNIVVRILAYAVCFALLILFNKGIIGDCKNFVLKKIRRNR